VVEQRALRTPITSLATSWTRPRPGGGKSAAIISVAIQRYAGDHTFENTTATIVLQGDEIKGRITAAKAQHRAFEAATGVTVLIDDTPGAVLLSGFDPVRRKVARESMVRLIADAAFIPAG